ncbi:MAG: hypothetical protein JNK79_00005, partial [Chitinophagaceae bacterium]|nr:hypothetical protein [Chitinophagaceae bacterium]
MQKSLALTLLLLSFALSILSQSDKPYPFAHYNLNNGLAAYNANTVVQDRQGYIWIGTINGLQRFDGHRFITFRRSLDNKSSLPDNYIDHLFYDSKANLWIVLGNGQLGIFDTRRFTFTPAILKVKDERTIKLPRRLTEDSDGNILFIIYGHEVTTYDAAKNEFSSANNKFPVPTNWKVTSLAEDKSSQRLWLATDSGMCVYNKRTRELSYRGNNAENIAFINKYAAPTQFLNLLIDSQSRFWFTTPNPNGIPLMSGFDISTGKVILENQDLYPNWIMKNYSVEKSMQQSNGSIWIAGLNVLMRFNEREKKFTPVYEEYSR